MDYFILLIILNDNFDETNDNYDNDPSALVKITMYQLLLLKSIENVQILYSLSLNTKHHFFEIRNIQRPDTEYYFTRDDIHIKKLHVIFVRYYSSVSNKRGVLIRRGKRVGKYCKTINQRSRNKRRVRFLSILVRYLKLTTNFHT